MSTWAELTEELSQCERKHTAVRLKVEEKLRKEEEKARGLAKKRQDVIKSNEESLANAQVLFERNIHAIQRKADEEIAVALKAQAAAVERKAKAEQAAVVAEERVRELNEQVKVITGLLNKTTSDQASLYEDVRNLADDAVRKKMEDTNMTVRNTSLYASAMQDGALDSITIMQETSRSTLSVAEAKSHERSRFKELYNAFVGRHQQTSDKAFTDAKEELLDGWYLGFLQGADQASDELHQPRVLLDQTVGQRSLGLDVAASGCPSPADERPRSVDRARRRAMEVRVEKDVRGKNQNPRPGTAP